GWRGPSSTWCGWSQRWASSSPARRHDARWRSNRSACCWRASSPVPDATPDPTGRTGPTADPDLPIEAPAPGRCARTSAAARRLAAVGLLDRRHQLALVHRRPAPDVEPAGHLHQMLLGRVGVDALGGSAPGVRSTALRAAIRRTLLRLGLPVVAHLLETVLEGAVGDPVGPLPLAVLLDGRVVRLGESALRLGIGLLQRAGQLALLGAAALGGLRHRVLAPSRQPQGSIEKGYPNTRAPNPRGRPRRPRLPDGPDPAHASVSSCPQQSVWFSPPGWAPVSAPTATRHICRWPAAAW